MMHTTSAFQRWSQAFNFMVGALVAAVLNLQPIPIGGLAPSIAATPGSEANVIAQGMAFEVVMLQWLMVGLCTLLSAQFWFSVLKRVVTATAPKAPAKTEVPGPTPATPAGTADVQPASGPGGSGRVDMIRSPMSATLTLVQDCNQR